MPVQRPRPYILPAVDQTPNQQLYTNCQEAISSIQEEREAWRPVSNKALGQSSENDRGLISLGGQVTKSLANEKEVLGISKPRVNRGLIEMDH
jgi:hypothetical protein